MPAGDIGIEGLSEPREGPLMAEIATGEHQLSVASMLH